MNAKQRRKKERELEHKFGGLADRALLVRRMRGGRFPCESREDLVALLAVAQRTAKYKRLKI